MIGARSSLLGVRLVQGHLDDHVELRVHPLMTDPLQPAGDSS